MKKITHYQIIEHGFDNPQYFPGCGTSFSEFEDCATGTGDTSREAYDDALESLAQSDWDTSTIRGKSKLSRQTVRGMLRAEGFRGADVEETEMLAYVSIRVK